MIPNLVFNSTPNGTSAQFGSIAGRGGIWMGGGGIAVDNDGNLFFSTGDGNFNAFPNVNGTDYGDSVIRLSTAGEFSVADYFTPYNQSYDRTNDLDVAGGGVVLLPDQPGPNPHLMIAAGKPQRAYLINRDMMTSDNNHIATTGTTDHIVQTMPLAGGSYDTPVYFNERIYYVASKDVMRSYLFSNGTLIADLPASAGSRTFAFPGATPFVSANGSDSGIVWAIQRANPAVLVAYNATNLSTELYSSDKAGSRDKLANGVKFAAPIVANGKVYVGSQYALSVFGLLNSGSGPTNFQPVNATYNGLFFESSGAEVGASGLITITTTKRGGYSGKLQLAANSYSFHGTFDSSGVGSSIISQKSGLSLSFQASADNSSISGTVSGNSWTAGLLANQQVFNHKNPTSLLGTYNLNFAGPNDGNPAEPQNNGHATVTINSSGTGKIKGALGDGTKVSESANISQSGDWPFFVSLYSRKGEIIGWLNFNGTAVTGQPTWIKLPEPKSKKFPNGFVLTPNVTGSLQ
jgi:hypothetical protein